MTRSRRDFLGRTAGLGAFLIAGPAFAANGEGFKNFSGRYRYVGGQKQLDRQLVEIDRVCDQMNFVFRQFARPKLIKSLKPSAWAKFDFKGSAVTIERPNIGTMKGVVDGGRVNWKDREGRDSTLTFKEKDSSLVVRAKQKDGLSVLTWQFKDDGRLTLRVLIDHDKMPDRLKYRLSYKR